MDTDIIYLVTPVHRNWGDRLEGFATDAKGVEAIVRKYYRKYLDASLIDVRVDLHNFTVVVVMPEGDCRQTYYLREIKRVT